jgi:hypothetical protein
VQPESPARHYIPRSHRLFAVFECRPEVESALLELGLPREDIWYYEGDAGAAALDPDRAPGPLGFFSWLYSHNIEDLHDLSVLVSEGCIVVAVPAKNLAKAEETARLLKGRGGQWFAYTAHGNFVPIVP